MYKTHLGATGRCYMMLHELDYVIEKTSPMWIMSAGNKVHINFLGKMYSLTTKNNRDAETELSKPKAGPNVYTRIKKLLKQIVAALKVNPIDPEYNPSGNAIATVFNKLQGKGDYVTRFIIARRQPFNPLNLKIFVDEMGFYPESNMISKTYGDHRDAWENLLKTNAPVLAFNKD